MLNPAFKILLAAILTAVIIFTPSASQNSFIINAYIRSTGPLKIKPEKFRKINAVCWHSISPLPDGSIDAVTLSAEAVRELNRIKKNYSTRILLTAAEHGKCPAFASISADHLRRVKFAKTLSELCLSAGFDGADIDWEYPEGKIQNRNFAKMLEAISDEFKKNRLILSAALSPSKIAVLHSDVYKFIDYAHLMSYDRFDNGPLHSTMQDYIMDISAFLSAGLPPGKIIAGLPFYGRKISDTSKALPYRTIVKKFSPAPASNTAGGWFFNGPELIKQKTLYALSSSIGGVMLWELSYDTDDSSSLLKTINATIYNYPHPVHDTNHK